MLADLIQRALVIHRLKSFEVKGLGLEAALDLVDSKKCRNLRKAVVFFILSPSIHSWCDAVSIDKISLKRQKPNTSVHAKVRWHWLVVCINGITHFLAVF